MGFAESVERSLARPLITFSLALTSLYLGYLTLREPLPEITIDVSNEANVFDVRRSLPELEVLFRGEDVQGNNLNLRLITVRLENTGQVDLLQDHFDHAQLWGLQVLGGRLIEVRLRTASSDYVEERLNPVLVATDKVRFEPLIFERGTLAIVELLVLHDRDESPSIRGIGKVAGIRDFNVTNSWESGQRLSLADQAFAGTISIHAIRLVVYTLVAVITAVSIGFILAGLAEAFRTIQRRARRRLAGEIVRTLGTDDRILQVLAAQYELNGAHPIVRLLDSLGRADGLRSLIRSTSAYIKHLEREAEDHGSDPHDLTAVHTIRGSTRLALNPLTSLIEQLVDAGVLNASGDVPPDAASMLRLVVEAFVLLLPHREVEKARGNEAAWERHVLFPAGRPEIGRHF